MQIGRLNLLTPSRVAAAAKEIRTGEIVPVKYVSVCSLIIPNSLGPGTRISASHAQY